MELYFEVKLKLNAHNADQKQLDYQMAKLSNIEKANEDVFGGAEDGGNLINPKKRKAKGTLVNPYIKKR